MDWNRFGPLGRPFHRPVPSVGPDDRYLIILNIGGRRGVRKFNHLDIKKIVETAVSRRK